MINQRAKNHDCWSLTRRHSHRYVYQDFTILPNPARGLGVKNQCSGASVHHLICKIATGIQV